MTDEPLVVQLARKQLDAYNRAALDEFCACYHPEIEVLDASGAVQSRGMQAFRARYAALFERFTDVHGEVDARLTLGPHVIEREHYARTDRATGERTSGVLLVRYTERDGLLRYAEFLRDP